MNGNVSIIYFGDFIVVPVVPNPHVHALYSAAAVMRVYDTYYIHTDTHTRAHNIMYVRII